GMSGCASCRSGLGREADVADWSASMSSAQRCRAETSWNRGPGRSFQGRRSTRRRHQLAGAQVTIAIGILACEAGQDHPLLFLAGDWLAPSSGLFVRLQHAIGIVIHAVECVEHPLQVFVRAYPAVTVG